MRYQKEYWSTYWEIRPGTYLAGDKAQRDKDGYITIQGRIDDVLKVAGHGSPTLRSSPLLSLIPRLVRQQSSANRTKSKVR